MNLRRTAVLRRLLPIALAGLGIALMTHPAAAQSINIDFGAKGDASSTNRIIQIFLLMTVLSVAPAILMMVTCFTRIVVVLSILRHALATNTAPPNTVIMSLAI